MKRNPRHDISLIIRLWKDDNSQQWRAIAINPRSGERNGFANLRDLWEFIEAQMAQMGEEDRESI